MFVSATSGQEIQTFFCPRNCFSTISRFVLSNHHKCNNVFVFKPMAKMFFRFYQELCILEVTTIYSSCCVLCHCHWPAGHILIYSLEYLPLVHAKWLYTVVHTVDAHVLIYFLVPADQTEPRTSAGECKEPELGEPSLSLESGASVKVKTNKPGGFLLQTGYNQTFSLFKHINRQKSQQGRATSGNFPFLPSTSPLPSPASASSWSHTLIWSSGFWLQTANSEGME